LTTLRLLDIGWAVVLFSSFVAPASRCGWQLLAAGSCLTKKQRGAAALVLRSDHHPVNSATHIACGLSVVLPASFLRTRFGIVYMITARRPKRKRSPSFVPTKFVSMKKRWIGGHLVIIG